MSAFMAGGAAPPPQQRADPTAAVPTQTLNLDPSQAELYIEEDAGARLSAPESAVTLIASVLTEILAGEGNGGGERQREELEDVFGGYRPPAGNQVMRVLRDAPTQGFTITNLQPDDQPESDD